MDACCDVNQYEEDTVIQLNGTFYNAQLNVPADPSTVNLFIQDPTGIVTQIAANLIVRSGVGVYYSEFLPSMPGAWTYKWQGLGNVVATSPDRKFFVRASPLLS